MFTIYNDSGSDSTMVSNLFIDEYMKSANDAQIKVYLYLLRMMGAHRSASVSDMADQFNHTEKDVVRSLHYWEKKGLLNLDYDNKDTIVSIHLCRPGSVSGLSGDNAGKPDMNHILSFSRHPENLHTETAQGNSFLRMASGGAYPAQASLQADAGSSPAPGAGEGGIRTSAGAPAPAAGISEAVPSSAPSELEALESFRSRSDCARLLFVIEQYIGKPLSLNEIRIIYSISQELHFSDDMIDYLLQYCVDRGKKDFRYIKKVAQNWAASGIMTPAQAENAAAQEKVSGRNRKSAGAAAGNSGDAGQSGTADTAARSGRKKGGKAAGRTRSANSFNQFEQNDYDFDALEEELLQS